MNISVRLLSEKPSRHHKGRYTELLERIKRDAVPGWGLYIESEEPKKLSAALRHAALKRNFQLSCQTDSKGLWVWIRR